MHNRRPKIASIFAVKHWSCQGFCKDFYTDLQTNCKIQRSCGTGDTVLEPHTAAANDCVRWPSILCAALTSPGVFEFYCLDHWKALCIWQDYKHVTVNVLWRGPSGFQLSVCIPGKASRKSLQVKHKPGQRERWSHSPAFVSSLTVMTVLPAWLALLSRLMWLIVSLYI